MTPEDETAHTNYPRTPSSTYRLQFNGGFTFEDGTAIVDYLGKLGISDCYSSPLLKSRPGSSHGYDVVSHDELNPEIGSDSEFDSFVAELRRHNMGLVLDIVPNHMYANEGNSRWEDLLEYGKFSESGRFFDVHWFVHGRRQERVLLPVLLGEYVVAIREGHLKIEFGQEAGKLFVRLQKSLRVPLTPSSYPSVLKRCLPMLGDESPTLSNKLRHLLHEFDGIPGPDTPCQEGSPDFREKGRKLQRRLALLCADPRVARAVKSAVVQVNQSPGSLDHVLKRQFYRLAFWRRAANEVNYRRFLSVNDLVGIRVEEPSVFEASHKLIFDLIARGKVTGLRVDHADGLWDPTQYFDRLQTRAKELSEEAGQDRSRAGPRSSFYVVAEKILRSDEKLQKGWKVDGTTGYDFMELVNGLFVFQKSFSHMANTFDEFIRDDGRRGRVESFDNVAYDCKKQAIRSLTAADVSALTSSLQEISEASPGYEDLTREKLASSIEQVAACFPIYRTYVSQMSHALTRDELKYVKTAIHEAERRSRIRDPRIWELLRKIFLQSPIDDRILNFVMKFQQFTPTVMVEGVENTAFYRYNVLASLEEVGGEPDRFGTSLKDFHRANLLRRQNWPHSMLASSTHDTKRSADVRARINVLSEIPAEWRSAVERWATLNLGSKSKTGGIVAPSKNDEYLFYQTLIGAWPLEGLRDDFTERIVAYMQKATNEAKQRTSWLHPDEAYSAAIERFVRGVLSENKDTFLGDFLALERKVSYFGMLNSLSQLLLNLTSPGVPDIYQGTELWDYSLVDPDNRREVDFKKRRSTLERLEKRRSSERVSLVNLAKELLEHPGDGAVKMFVLSSTLRFRQAHRHVFEGTYVPLSCTGPRNDYVCAFSRESEGESVVVAAPRFFATLAGGDKFPFDVSAWGDTKLLLENPRPTYHNLFTGELLTPRPFGRARSLDLSEVFRDFPVALLYKSNPTSELSTASEARHAPAQF